MKIDDAVLPVHASAGTVSITDPTDNVEQLFAHAVVFVPVRAAHPAPGSTFCDHHPSHLPPAGPDEQLAVLDVTLMWGGRRRDSVCGRCITGALHVADRTGPFTVWLIDQTAERAEPLPLGTAATWPAAAVPPAVTR